MTNIIKFVFIVWAFLAQAGQVRAPQELTTLYFPIVSRAGLSLPPEDEASQRIHVPAGFEIRIFAAGLPAAPRLMDFSPDGGCMWL